jgi:hypothetical protein
MTRERVTNAIRSYGCVDDGIILRKNWLGNRKTRGTREGRVETSEFRGSE